MDDIDDIDSLVSIYLSGGMEELTAQNSAHNYTVYIVLTCVLFVTLTEHPGCPDNPEYSVHSQ